MAIKRKMIFFTVAYESDSIYIDGVVSKPTLLKSTRIWQTIIVNNRVISDKTIMRLSIMSTMHYYLKTVIL